MRHLIPLLLLACGTPAPEPSPADDTLVVDTDETDPSTDSDLDSPVAPMDTLVDCGTLDVCHGDCVDTLTDPLNCGACDRTCVIAQGVPACSNGSCTLEACQEGWSDCDDDLANGCEAAISCDEGAACLSSCGTTGSITCGDGCEPSCLPPAEVCNAEDDDCNGSCDDGPLPGCRVGIHRAHGPLGHDYGPDAAELIGRGGTIEATDYFHLYGAATAGFRPLFRCTKASGKRFLTTSTDCEGTGAPESTLGFIAASAVCGATPLYRTLNAAGAAHFYTVSAPERDNAVHNLGFLDEGIAGYVW